jgi:hypothetical protein
VGGEGSEGGLGLRLRVGKLDILLGGQGVHQGFQLMLQLFELSCATVEASEVGDGEGGGGG